MKKMTIDTSLDFDQTGLVPGDMLKLDGEEYEVVSTENGPQVRKLEGKSRNALWKMMK